MVERWFAELTEKWLRRGTHRPTKELTPIAEWIETWNGNLRPYEERAPPRLWRAWSHIADQSLLQDTASGRDNGSRPFTWVLPLTWVLPPNPRPSLTQQR
jgi:hypothetical protein